MHVYGGVQHTFTNPAATGAGIPGIAYDERCRPPFVEAHCSTCSPRPSTQPDLVAALVQPVGWKIDSIVCSKMAAILNANGRLGS